MITSILETTDHYITKKQLLIQFTSPCIFQQVLNLLTHSLIKTAHKLHSSFVFCFVTPKAIRIGGLLKTSVALQAAGSTIEPNTAATNTEHAAPHPHSIPPNNTVQYCQHPGYVPKASMNGEKMNICDVVKTKGLKMLLLLKKT